MYTEAMPVSLFRKILCRVLSGLIAIAILLQVPRNVEAASDDIVPSMTAAPLSVEQVVGNLVRRNEERSRSLVHCQATRIYHLTYRGFPSDREAEMTVEASYDSPSTKDFKIVSQSGSKIILERVFKRLLESEKEAAQPEMRARTQLNWDNYDFTLVGYESSASQYVLQVNPKVKNKYVYRGKVWVDANDFAVTRIEAEPAQNPSFWTKRSEIHHEYAKVENSWLPVRNESVSYIRLGGRATLTIAYKDYRLTESGDASAPISAFHADISPLQ